jgi:hypothetical protein
LPPDPALKFIEDAAALGLAPEDVFGATNKPRRKRRKKEEDEETGDA